MGENLRSQLILLEGMPGTGKSTTTHWLYRELKERSISARWFSEVAKDYPVKVQLDTLNRENVVECHLQAWESCLRRLNQGEEIFLLDCGLFQKAVRCLMDYLSFTEIMTYVKSVEKLIQSTNPILIYYYPKSVEEHLLKTYHRRGKQFEELHVMWTTSSSYSKDRGYEGIGGSIMNWTEYKKLCDQLFDQIQFQKLTIDSTEELWDQYQQQILDFLKLPTLEGRKTTTIPSNWKDLIGTYQRVEVDQRENSTKEKIADQKQETIFHKIERHEEHLYITQLLFKYTKETYRLIPFAENNFVLQGHEIELHFDPLQSLIYVQSNWPEYNGLILCKVKKDIF